MLRRRPGRPLFPYTTLFRSGSVLRPRRDGRANGIAWVCFETEKAYLCNDTGADANYARYFLDVGSVLADRKSTRLNSSHSSISYAVFCLKKKTDRRVPPGIR